MKRETTRYILQLLPGVYYAGIHDSSIMRTVRKDLAQEYKTRKGAERTLERLKKQFEPTWFNGKVLEAK